MTQEEKQLLLKDLCARLPYGVKIQSWYGEIITSNLNTFPFSAEEMDEKDMWSQLSGFKPYLRPMSSMTYDEHRDYIQTGRSMSPDNPSALVDWLNAHHLDYRGLIPMGLALEAPQDMYKTE